VTGPLEHTWRTRLAHRATQALSMGLNTVGAFVLPFAVGLGACALFETSEVKETSDRALAIAALVLAPMILLQLASVAVRTARTWRDLREADPAQGRRSPWLLFDALATSSAVVTRRGAYVLITGLLGLVASLGLQWAQFAVFAVVVLGAFYVVVSVAVAVAAFGVRGRATTRVARRIEPVVCSVGDQARDTFEFDARVPSGFSLRIQAPLGDRIGGETRLLVEGTGAGTTLASAPLPRTPRGLFALPAATVHVEDFLGITAVQVASLPGAELKVLPRAVPLLFVSAALVRTQHPEASPRPRPRPTDDLLSLKSFVVGDDARRIHWRQSLRAGEWMVRVPESRPSESRRVRLVLDTHLGSGVALSDADRTDLLGVLDTAVDVWLALARQLHDDGHEVELVAAVAADHSEFGGAGVIVESLPCSSTREAVWRDVGARVTWQRSHTLDTVLAGQAGAIVVCTGLGADGKTPCTSIVVDTLACVRPLPPGCAPRGFERFFRNAHPAGSDDNHPVAVVAANRRNKARRAEAKALRERIVQRGSLAPADFVVEAAGARLRLRHGVKTKATALLTSTTSSRGRAA